MYDIINKLKDVSIVEFYDKDKNFISSVLFTDVSFSFIGFKERYTLNDFNEEWAYQNVEIHSKTFDKLIIFQDYGDDSHNVPSGYDYLNRSLVLPDNNSNLGYYNGKFVHIVFLSDYVRVYDLFESELPDLTSLRQKRPYTFSIATKENKLYYYVTLSTDKNFVKLYKLDVSLDKILSIENINSVLEGRVNNVFFERAKSTTRYISRDYLVKNNYSYNNGVWTKGSVTLTDTSNRPPLFLKLKDKFIFEIEELERISFD